MSKYTTEVRFICEQAAGYTESQGFDKVEEILAAAAPKVFNFPFPIFREDYRLPLEIKILRHFYTREICEETVGLWKLRLSAKLNEIMPYYNQLYESELLEFNPFWDTDLTRDSHTGFEGTENTSENTEEGATESASQTIDGTTTRNATDTNTRTIHSATEQYSNSSGERHGDTTHTESGTSTNTRWDLYSDTPQGGINGIEPAPPDPVSPPELRDTSEDTTIDSNYYLTNARKITDNGATTGESHDVTADTNVESSSTTNTTDSTDSFSDTVRDTLDLDQTTDSEATRNTVRERLAERGIAHEEDFLSHIKGKQGGASYSHMLMEFRNAMLNIDQMILNELSPLFFGLW